MLLLNEKEKKMMVEVRGKNGALCSRLTRDEKGKLTKAKDSLIFSFSGSLKRSRG